MRHLRSRLSKKKNSAESISEPGTGVRPFLAGLVNRNAQNGGSLLVAQTAKVPKLDDPGGGGVLGGEPGKGVAQREQAVFGRWSGLVGKIDADKLAAVFESTFAAGVVHQDATHGSGGSREEMAATVPYLVRVAPNQAQVGLVDQSGRFERLPG